MKTYTGNIKPYFIAEVEFQIKLPQFCENQKFELFEEIDNLEQKILEFSLILNSRRAIEHTDTGLIEYTGEVELNEVETTVISQVRIEKNEVENFIQRAFILKVL